MVGAIKECSAISGSGLGCQRELDILPGRRRLDHHLNAPIAATGLLENCHVGRKRITGFSKDGMQTSLERGHL